MRKTQMPSGINPLVGNVALKLDNAKNELIKLYLEHGFEFVIPPIISFASSENSFKFSDSLSNKTLEIIDDITPQISIIDEGQTDIKKYCYANNIIKPRPDDFYSSRSPMQVGAEIYGDLSLNADFNVVDLMLKSLDKLGIKDISLTVGNVAIFNLIIKYLSLENHTLTLKNIFSKKSLPDLTNFIQTNNLDNQLLDYLNCDKTCLLDNFKIDNLESEITKVIDLGEKFKNYKIIYDFADTKTYDYHNGLIFAAYAPSYSKAIARGGRFLSPSSRVATGFSFDLGFLLK
jgi:ATP phosphoribosyltransferase regulatory subunit